MKIMEFKKFKINDIFSTPDKGDVDLQQDDINGKGEFFINSGKTNFGIKGKTDRKARIFPPNTITIDFWGNAYYRDYNYKLATHNHVFSFNDDVIKNKEVGLYLVGTLRFLNQKYSYSNMLTWKKLKKETIILPVISGTHQIDFDYMENHIKALKRDKIRALDTYLNTIKLDNYRLTPEDIKILRYKPKFLKYKVGHSYSKRKKIVIVSDDGLFNIIPTKKKINANRVKFEGKFPYVARGEGKNGIRGYINYDPDFLNPANTISFGQDTATMYYQPNRYFTGDKIQIFEINKKYGNLTENKAMYLISSMKKAFSNFEWGTSSFALEVLANIDIKLPVTANNTIDFEYMEKYIQVIKKLMIKDVVKHKDKALSSIE